MDAANMFSPAYDVETPAGAIMQAMFICGGNISEKNLHAFLELYKGKMGFETEELLSSLLEAKSIFRVEGNAYTLNPMFAASAGETKPQDAFVVWLEFAKRLDILATTTPGFHPAQISFLYNGALYHIAVVEGSGQNELMKFMRLDINLKARIKASDEPQKQKVILVFRSEEDAMNCQYRLLNMETIYCILPEEEGKLLRFLPPDYFQTAKENACTNEL